MMNDLKGNFTSGGYLRLNGLPLDGSDDNKVKLEDIDPIMFAQRMDFPLKVIKGGGETTPRQIDHLRAVE